ncbi:MAG: class I SAM-dependent methyltransferase [Ginsengibacter sp.]
MKIKDAAALIQKAFGTGESPQHWADLGCGTGTFTSALANCLEPGSSIYAVDKKMPAIASVNNVNIQCLRADMETIVFRDQELHGILMANSFHYIKDKSGLIQRLRSFLRSDGRFLVVEYDAEKANAWVPYPLNFAALALLFKNSGFRDVDKIGERNSIFGPQNMYACVIKD